MLKIKLPTSKEVLFSLIFIGMLVAMFFILPGCRTTKNIDKAEVKVEERTNTEVDSLNQAIEDLKERHRAEKREWEYSGVVFDSRPYTGPIKSGTPDTFWYPNPCPHNEVKVNKDGTIEAKGNIGSVFLSKEKYEKTTLEQARRIEELSKVKKKAEVITVTKVVTITKTIKRKPAIGGYIIALAVGLIIGIYFFPWLKTKFFKFFT